MLISIPNDQIISFKELNYILLKQKDKKHSNIEITFEKPIQKIDIAFIAGLILYNKKHEIKFSITGNFVLDKDGKNRRFEVRQYLRQYEKIFGIKWQDIFTDIKFLSIEIQGQPIENELIDKLDYIASESFAPIILVNKDSIDNFFRTITPTKTTELSQLREKYIAKVRQGGNEVESKYPNSKESIIKQLTGYPPIHTFVFTVLYNKIKPFKGIRSSSNTKEIKEAEERTEELWEFTKEYVKGLHELAKNIVEHSSTEEGIITIRAYDEIEQEKENKDKILETHVFDFGGNGIIQKLLEDTKKKKSLHRIYEEDVETLSESFNMKDFIKPTVTKKLNQQLYRDLAHYGLTKFYKLIEKNEGIVVSSSTKKNGERDSYPDNHTKTLAIGTSYFFQLPFKPELFKSTESIALQDGLQGSSQTISGLSELMKIEVIKDIANYKKGDKNVLFDYKPEITNVKDRQAEAKLFKSFADLGLKDQGIKYLAINMKDIEMFASNLLRFLAHLSTNYPQSIILYNLDFKLYDEMIEDNKQFYNTLKDLENIPYWYENSGLLLFSIQKVKDMDMDFTFADVLFGETETEFESANHIISHTFPNTLSIIKEISENKKFEIPDCLKPFFYQSSLLPFDLLLCHEENKTLFQSNLEILLNTEIPKIAP